MPFDGTEFTHPIMVLYDRVSRRLSRGKNWVQDTYGVSDGRVCLMGAIIEADCRDISAYEAKDNQSIRFFSHEGREVVRAMRQLAHDRGFEQVEDFNDSTETSFRDVRRFIKDLGVKLRTKVEGLVKA